MCRQLAGLQEQVKPTIRPLEDSAPDEIRKVDRRRKFV
jgi:hypothetical protein